MTQSLSSHCVAQQPACEPGFWNERLGVRVVVADTAYHVDVDCAPQSPSWLFNSSTIGQAPSVQLEITV
jgi:hypothetical protein